jgi:hypothetical protein
MRGIIILFVLIAVVLVCGCTTPATVAKEMPGVLKNVSADISAMETPNVTLENVLQPLRTSVGYVQPARVVPTPITLKSPVDPIVGNWLYAGNSYQCHVRFYQEGHGSAVCSLSVITLADKSFKWSPAPSPYNWMRNYTLTDNSNGNGYSVMYSENTGTLTGDIIPDQGYLVKVG